MLLTDKERTRFVKWLEMTASNCTGMAKQCELLSGPAISEIAKREKIKAAACLLIACDLQSAESMTID